jgi:hypothetical protein
MPMIGGLHAIEKFYGWLVTFLMRGQSHAPQQDLERRLKRIQLITIGVLVVGIALFSLIDAELPKYDARGVANNLALAIDNVVLVVGAALFVGCILILLVADSMRKRIKKAAKTPRHAG